MLEFIQLLNQRYQAVISHLNDENPLRIIYQQRLEQLIFTEAFIRKGYLLQTSPQTPLQIAIIGPTQAGKSSVSNLLLNSQQAGVSPLAGYTVHPQGFCCASQLADNMRLQHYFGRFQQLPLNELTANRHDCYALTATENTSYLLPPCVFWDTPDFDSINSLDYREGVIRTIALADIIILVVSKEKYADQSVWDMMQMIEAFHQPTLVCINKLTEGTEEIILNSFQEKWQNARKDNCPSIIPLFYQKQHQQPVWNVKNNHLIADLKKQVSQQQHIYQHEIINQYWHQWLKPIVAEHEASQLWNQLIDNAIKQAMSDYQRDYLNHPHYYQTFQNAIVELLTLLEIPFISKVLTKTRRALTWPIRKIRKLGQSYQSHSPNKETEILTQIAEHLLIALTEQLLEKIDSDTKLDSWWKEMYCQLRQQRHDFLQHYTSTISVYQSEFQHEIEATANGLYHKLSEQPVILNSLRATRITTDAAVMALVIQTGGIGLHDLVITPAMLSITSLLAESAIGSYMNHAEVQLKQQQLNTVKQQLFESVLKSALYQLPKQLSDKTRFNISIEQLIEAEQQRKEKKHGIRIL